MSKFNSEEEKTFLQTPMTFLAKIIRFERKLYNEAPSRN